MPKQLGRAVLALSSVGFPLTQLVMRRFGRRGAVAVELVCAGLLVRDAALIATGAPRVLRRGPAILLWLELMAAAAAVLASLRPVFDAEAQDDTARSRPTSRLEVLRRAAIGALFGLHTVRFRIYLQPDHGLRQPP